MEYFAHDFRTTLQAELSSTSLSMTPASMVGAPTQYPFRIRIGNELLLVTGQVAGLTWNISRGIEGTQAATHPAGRTVSHVITAGMLTDLWAKANSSSVPNPGAENNVLTSKGGIWQSLPPTGGGGGGAGTLPTLASFAWVNQGTATAADSTAGLRMTHPPVAGEVLRLLQRALPATPYTISLRLQHQLVPIAYSFAGLALRDNAGGAGLMFRLKFEGAQYYYVQAFNASHTASAAPVASRPVVWPSPVWLQLRDDGTNRHFEFSTDGVNFLTLLTQGRTVTITPTHYALALSSGQTGHTIAATYSDWKGG